MRGRRAFVVLTFYLLLLGGFAWMVEPLVERARPERGASGGSVGLRLGAIGQGIFGALADAR